MNANFQDARSLWRNVLSELVKKISNKPLWLSTAGNGVHWLHVRISSKPKYYRYAPYTYHSTSQSNTEHFTEANFGSNTLSSVNVAYHTTEGNQPTTFHYEYEDSAQSETTTDRRSHQNGENGNRFFNGIECAMPRQYSVHFCGQIPGNTCPKKTSFFFRDSSGCTQQDKLLKCQPNNGGREFVALRHYHLYER